MGEKRDTTSSVTAWPTMSEPSDALALAVFEADFIEKPRNTLGNVVSNPFLYKADIVANVSVKRLQRR